MLCTELSAHFTAARTVGEEGVLLGCSPCADAGCAPGRGAAGTASTREALVRLVEAPAELPRALLPRTGALCALQCLTGLMW